MTQNLEQLVKEPSLASVNGKARLDGGPVETFKVWWLSDLSEAIADPRTFDPQTMTRDAAQVSGILAEREAAAKAEAERIAAEAQAKFDAAVAAEVERRMASGK